ncbi:hypothetical protein ACE1OC_42915 (plasmid) [Streptomyces sp. DSM 116496]|uniref:hypothetical protein n=1 Tax=Streptomyces stoeckheimensis TaxID=3344656 RepID=UPI0038B3F802
MSDEASINVSAATHARLAVLAAARGTTIQQLVEDLAEQADAGLASVRDTVPGGPAELLGERPGSQMTATEREQRVLQAAAELGLEYTVQVQHAGQAVWDKIRAHQDGSAG